jgi:hypothetical protein
MIKGTSAKLLSFDRLTVEQLLFGMMLPSGNDAAQMLGIFFGQILMKSTTWRQQCASQQKSASPIKLQKMNKQSPKHDSKISTSVSSGESSSM